MIKLHGRLKSFINYNECESLYLTVMWSRTLPRRRRRPSSIKINNLPRDYYSIDICNINYVVHLICLMSVFIPDKSWGFWYYCCGRCPTRIYVYVLQNLGRWGSSTELCVAACNCLGIDFILLSQLM